MQSKENRRARAIARNITHKPRYIREAMKSLGLKEGQKLNKDQQAAVDAVVNHKIGIPKVKP